MLWVTLEDIKRQVRVAPADTQFDAELTRHGDAAERHVAKYLNRRSAAALEDLAVSGVSPPELPADIRNAILMFAEMYFDRKPEDAPTLTKAAHDLIDFYRVDDIGV